MFWFIYHLPLWVVAVFIALSVIIWAAVMRALKNNAEIVKAVNILLLFVSVFGIIYITLFRSETVKREIILIPFHSFVEAVEQKEMYRSMLMNVFLFTPFGLSAMYSIPESLTAGKRTVITVCAAAVISIVIEALQYIFCIGRCEIDDIICNSFGALIGSVSYILSKMKVQNEESFS